jgi:hypothetical protein
MVRMLLDCTNIVECLSVKNTRRKHIGNPYFKSTAELKKGIMTFDLFPEPKKRRWPSLMPS